MAVSERITRVFEAAQRASQQYIESIKVLEENIYLMAGHEFNIASPKQLGIIIFEEMQLAKGKKNKTGYVPQNSLKYLTTIS